MSVDVNVTFILADAVIDFLRSALTEQFCGGVFALANEDRRGKKRSSEEDRRRIYENVIFR